jgi:hypothetical protein
MDYSFFIKKVAEQFLENGWKKLDAYNELIDLAVARDETTTVVTTKGMMAFLNGDMLSKDEIKQVLESVHKTRKEAAMPPLCPTTTVLVFVFKHAQNSDWIREKAKKRDLLVTNYTVSWVVDLTEGTVKKHKGLPMIGSGESEIEAALSSGAV